MFADLGCVRVHYEDVGEGEPVVLIGGFGTSARFWSKAAASLSGFRVIAPDNRGVGETEYRGGFTVDDMADDVAALLDRLGICRAHVLGWSLGTHIGMSMALRHEARVRSLTLVAPFLKSPARSEYVVGTLTRMAYEGAVPVECLNVVMNAFCFTESEFRSLADSGRSMPVPRKPESPGGLMDQMAAALSSDMTGAASRIRVPTMVVHGDCDIMVEPQEGRRVADSISGCRFVLVEGAGHNIPFAAYRDRFMSFMRNEGR